MDVCGRVDADLDHATAVSAGPGARLRGLVVSGVDHAEREPARRQECPPVIVLTDELRAQADSVVHGHGGPVALDVDMHPRWTVDLLKVDVRPPS